MKDDRFCRRKVIVDRRFQVGVALRVILMMAGYLAFFYLLAVFAPFMLMVFSGGTEEAMATATRHVLVFVEDLLLPLGLTFACLALHCILLTHRIAGPVFRFRQTMKDAAAGDWSRSVRLRSGDYLHALAADWNLLVEEVRRSIDAARTELREAITEARAGEGGAAAVQRLTGRAEKALDALESFRTGTGEGDEPLPAGEGQEAEEQSAVGV